MLGIARGMVTTFKHLLRPAITYGYPDTKRELPSGSRMSFELLCDEHGEPQCKSCLLCMRSCPDNAIIIESEKNPDGPGRILTKFSIDLGRCMYCGLCVEQCTTAGLVHTTDFETCSHDPADMMLVIYERQIPESELSAAVTDEGVRR